MLWDTVVDAATPNEKGMLGALRIRNLKTGEERELPVNGLFFAIGHEPASKFLNGQVACQPSAPVFSTWRSGAQDTIAVFLQH